MRIPETPPNWIEAIKGVENPMAAFVRTDVQEFVRSANDKYLHWDKLRHLPLPKGFSPPQAWAAVEFSRTAQFQRIPITFGKKGQLKYWLPPQHQEWVSVIDQQAGGFIGTNHRRAVPDDNERYLFNSLMEEAIASSRLEGASTTREVAKEMLRTGRRPRDKAEQMILNNYRAILDIRDRKHDPLTPELLCHLQKVLTEKTLDNPDAGGRFRRADEPVCVADAATGDSLCEPPDASLVAARVQEICDFANTKSVPFIHPAIKATALHFALGYVHPFVDGNGRTARAVFYWYMLKCDFWLFEYLPISRIIADSQTGYGRAYLYSETDRGDLTHFNHYHLGAVIRAIRELFEYLSVQQQQLSQAEDFLDKYPELNHRQRSMIQNALKHPNHTYTIREHEGKYRVTYNTARADLLGLEKAGLLFRTSYPKEKEAVFHPPPDLINCLKRPGASKQATTNQPVRTGKNSIAKKIQTPAPVPSLFDVLDRAKTK